MSFPARDRAHRCNPLQRRLYVAMVAGFALLVVGTLGYSVVEGWDLLDSLWMAVVTLSTVGYGEVHPLGSAGRLFTMVYLLVGMVILAYTVGTLSQLLFEGELRNLLGQHRMLIEIQELKDHFIVCGYGRSGRSVALDLVGAGFDVVAIEKETETVTSAGSVSGVPVVHGDATHDDVLEECGVRRARGLIACLPEDFHNVFVVLTARELNPRINIVAQALESTSEPKLRRAGANHIINLAHIGGKRMAAAVLKPGLLDFLDVVMTMGEMGMRLEELEISADSTMAGKALVDSGIRNQSGAIILALRRDGKYVTNPSPDERLQDRDALIALGTHEQLSRLKSLV